MKRKRLIAIILTLLLVTTMTVGLLGCNGEYTVEFYIGEKLLEVETTVNGKFSYTYPAKKNELFKGWYTDKALTKPFKGNKVNRDIKLYAGVVVAPIDPIV